MQNRAMKKYAPASAAISACARATSISCARFGPPQESLDEEFLPQRTQSVVRCACSSFVLANPPFIPLCQRGKEGDFPGRKGKTSTDSALCAFARVTLVSLRRRRGVRWWRVSLEWVT